MMFHVGGARCVDAPLDFRLPTRARAETHLVIAGRARASVGRRAFAMAASSAEASTPCLLLVADKKLAKLAELISAPHDGVHFLGGAAIDVPALLAAQPGLVVLHKGGYDTAVAEHDASAAARLALLRELPSRALLEPLECAARFGDRREVCRALAELAPAVAQPRFVELDAATGDVDGVLARAGVAFPLLCKPAVACGPRGHRLSLVLRRDGLDAVLAEAAGFGTPLIAQEYVDHGGVVLKGYTVGELVHIATRDSLPDLGHALAGGGGGGGGGGSCCTGSGSGSGDGSPGALNLPAVVHVDSQQPLADALRAVTGRAAPTLAPAAAAVCIGDGSARADEGSGERLAAEDGSTNEDDGALGRRRECEEILRAVRARMGVSLLGVDMVIAPDGRLLVVDVNHFSGAPRSVPGFGEALARAVATHSGDGE